MRMPARTLEEYLSLPYHIELTPDCDEEGRRGWVAEVVELPGCISQGESPDEAVVRVRDAMSGWISVALEDDLDIPEPSDSSPYSGQFRVRLPKGLHAAISRAAAREGVSLNQFVTGALAGAVRWRAES